MGAGDGRRPTIYDVAARAGVSKSLVSLVLGGSLQVSERRRAAVLSAIEELGYRPSQAATLLASARTRTIEVLIDDYANPSFVGLVRGLQGGFTGHGYHVTVTESRTGEVSGEGRSPLSTPADGRVLAAEAGPALLSGWAGPTVVAGARESVPAGADLVSGDDEQGVRLACEHLTQLGHRRIGHLTGAGGPALLRRRGFEGYLGTIGVAAVVAGDRGTTEQDGYAAAERLLEAHPDLTALVAANDVMALGAMAALRARGKSVPQDVSVVGYDNSTLAQSRHLSLTSVDDHSTQVGAVAAAALLARLADPEARPRHELVEPHLLVRGTTARPVR